MQPQTKLRLVAGIGEVLWDMLPQGCQLGGAPANFAYHAHALGADSWPVTRVGQDALGQEILERFHALGLRTDCVTLDPSAPTGTVAVELSPEGQPRFMIHENVAWDRLELNDAARSVAARADAVCFGTLAQRSTAARTAIGEFLSITRRDALRIFDINLRQQYFSPDLIAQSLAQANVLKINDQELPVVAALFSLTGSPAEQLAELARRHQLSLVALTCGANGSVLYAQGQFSHHPGKAIKVLDSVGAGDAFTAAMVMGWLASWDLDRINEHANAVAAFVCSQPGATPVLPPHLIIPA